MNRCAPVHECSDAFEWAERCRNLAQKWLKEVACIPRSGGESGKDDPFLANRLQPPSITPRGSTRQSRISARNCCVAHYPRWQKDCFKYAKTCAQVASSHGSSGGFCSEFRTDLPISFKTAFCCCKLRMFRYSEGAGSKPTKYLEVCAVCSPRISLHSALLAGAL